MQAIHLRPDTATYLWQHFRDLYVLQVEPGQEAQDLELASFALDRCEEIEASESVTATDRLVGHLAEYREVALEVAAAHEPPCIPDWRIALRNREFIDAADAVLDASC